MSYVCSSFPMSVNPLNPWNIDRESWFLPVMSFWQSTTFEDFTRPIHFFHYGRWERLCEIRLSIFDKHTLRVDLFAFMFSFTFMSIRFYPRGCVHTFLFFPLKFFIKLVEYAWETKILFLWPISFIYRKKNAMLSFTSETSFWAELQFTMKNLLNSTLNVVHLWMSNVRMNWIKRGAIPYYFPSFRNK